MCDTSLDSVSHAKSFDCQRRPYLRSESHCSHSKCSQTVMVCFMLADRHRASAAALMESEMWEMRTRCVCVTDRGKIEQTRGTELDGGGWVYVLSWPKQRANRSVRGEKVREVRGGVCVWGGGRVSLNRSPLSQLPWKWPRAGTSDWLLVSLTSILSPWLNGVACFMLIHHSGAKWVTVLL